MRPPSTKASPFTSKLSDIDVGPDTDKCSKETTLPPSMDAPKILPGVLISPVLAYLPLKSMFPDTFMPPTHPSSSKTILEAESEPSSFTTTSASATCPFVSRRAFNVIELVKIFFTSKSISIPSTFPLVIWTFSNLLPLKSTVSVNAICFVNNMTSSESKTLVLEPISPSLPTIKKVPISFMEGIDNEFT